MGKRNRYPKRTVIQPPTDTPTRTGTKPASAMDAWLANHPGKDVLDWHNYLANLPTGKLLRITNAGLLKEETLGRKPS